MNSTSKGGMVIRAWVCIDRKEAVGYIHYNKKKPMTDTNYDVYWAEIRPLPKRGKR